MNEEQPFISDGEKVVILFLAVVLDVLSIIPGLGTIVAIIGIFSIGVWSWVRLGKLPLTRKLRKFITKRAFVFLIEVLPVAQIFPGWTVMALMGIRRGPTHSGVASLLAPLLLLALWPARTLALELTYPSFFPLREGLQLNELVQLIFTASLTLGAILAFISLVYTGFEYIVSGNNAGKRSVARQHIIATVIGIIILLGSFTFVRFINPDLVVLPPLIVDALNIESSKVTSGQDPATEEIGGDYSRIRLSENIEILNEVLTRVQGEDETILASIASLMEECDSTLCTAGSVPYRYLAEYDCSYPSCGLDGNGEESCVTIPKTCSQCAPGTCVGASCSGEPLTGREGIGDVIEEAGDRLEELLSLFALLQNGRSIIASCGENTHSCVTSQITGSSSSCDPVQDFFCGTNTTPNVSLPFRDIAEQEGLFIENIKDISQRVLSATCSNTTFECDGGCGVAKGQCTPSEAPSGCPAELFDHAETLAEIAEQMEGQRDNLLSIIDSIDATLTLSLETGGEILLRSCDEARRDVTRLREAGIYSNGTCATTTTCCPTPAVVGILDACDPVDLFICS